MKIYYLSSSDERSYPEIDFTLKENNSYEWPDLYSSSELEEFNWCSVRLKVTMSQPIDVLRFDAHLLVSQRAQEVLQAVVGNQCAFYRLTVNENAFFLLEVRNRVACMDHSRSKVKYFPGTMRVSDVQIYAFHKNLIIDPSVFCLPEDRVSMFCTPIVKAALEDARLIGFSFHDAEEPSVIP